MPGTCTIPDGYEIAEFPFGENYVATRPNLLPCWDALLDAAPKHVAELLRKFGCRPIASIHHREVDAMNINSTTYLYMEYNAILRLLCYQILTTQRFWAAVTPYTVYIKEA